MIFPLMACNAYQVLMLPKYNRLSAEERARRAPKKDEPQLKHKGKKAKASR